jgi:hypothetical protein
MSSLTKFGSRVRSIGQKITGSVRNVGQKIYGIAMRLTPGLAAINPMLGAATVSIAGISGGVSRIAGAAQNAIEGRMNFKDAIGNIKPQAMAVKHTYGEGKSAVSSALERRR